jgi:hypothetical protein
MRRMMLAVVAVMILGSVLAACGGGKPVQAQAVESYLQAMVGKDAAKVSTLVCKDWASQAALETDAFQAVTATLADLNCTQSGTDGATALVSCQGKIIATYNNEKQELDLSRQTYKVVQEGGDWRVCGYR